MTKKSSIPNKFLAIPITYNDTTIYISVISSKTLFATAKISRADEDKEQGYQRLLNKKRAKEIADYINQGNVIASAIILSAEKTAQLKFDDNNFTYSLAPDSFIVIDGQHRLYGEHMNRVRISHWRYIFLLIFL